MIPKCKQEKNMYNELDTRVENLETIEESQLILTDYIDSNSIDINKVFRVGKVVRVDFRGKTAKQIPNSTEFLRLPFLPTAEGCFFWGIGSRYTADSIRWGFYGGSGALKSGTIESDKYIHIHFTYIIK